MAKEKVKIVQDHGPMGYVLFMAWVGALVYFVQLSEGFGGFLLAFLKSVVWPAYLLYELMTKLGV